MLDFFNQFNWIDIFVFIIFLRIFYVSSKTGLPAEFFKILGTFSALYLSLHYYTPLTDFVSVRFGNKNPPAQIYFVSFVALSLIGYAVFILVRLSADRLVKTELNAELSKWLGLTVGLARTVFLSSLILFIFLVSGLAYFKKSIEKSYFGTYLVRVAPSAYSWFWHNITAKFMTSEKFNKSVKSTLEVK